MLYQRRRQTERIYKENKGIIKPDRYCRVTLCSNETMAHFSHDREIYTVKAN